MNERTIKATGKANISTNGNRILIEASDGTVAVMIACGDGAATIVWHPLSGWFAPAEGSWSGGPRIEEPTP